MTYLDMVNLEGITLKQLIDWTIAFIGVLSFIVQFSKRIPFNPWSFILSQLGKSLNRNVTDKLEVLERHTTENSQALNDLKNDMDSRFLEKQKDDDEKEAKRLRSRIIEFADSCRVKQPHTKTAFENIMRDYDDYMAYCTKHEIPNHFIDEEHEYITDVFHRCLNENKFL